MRKFIVTAVAATALAVPALGLGACGGEGEDGGSSDDQAATTTVTTTTEAAAPPEAEGPSLVSFIAAADAICREFNRQSRSIRECGRRVPPRVEGGHR